MIFEKLAALLAEQFSVDADSITMDTTFEDLGADSLDIVEMTMAGEEEGEEEAAPAADAAQSDDFWNKDESELQAPEAKQPAEVDYSAFQGVQFSK